MGDAIRETAEEIVNGSLTNWRDWPTLTSKIEAALRAAADGARREAVARAAMASWSDPVQRRYLPPSIKRQCAALASVEKGEG